MSKRLEIDSITRSRLELAMTGALGQWKRSAAENILKQGWISPLQKHHIFSKDYVKSYTKRSFRGGRGGYVTGE